MNYTRNLLLFLLIMVFGFAQGQEDKMKSEKNEFKKPKHEVRIIMENFFGKNNEADPYDQIVNHIATDALDNYSIYKSKFSYGLGYNLNLNHIGVRTRFYYSSSSDSYVEPPYGIEIESNHSQYKIGLGVVYQKHFEKLTFFVGADYLMFEMKTKAISKYYSREVEIAKGEVVLNYQGHSIEPLVGFKYFLLKNFSISTELRLSFDKFSANRENVYDDFQDSSYSRDKSFDFDGYNNSIGPNGTISFNFHF